MLKIQHGVGSALYAMLRQALASRRALLLLDGLDEGGRYLPEIQRHVTEVLAPQGHILLVSSRPTISEAHFTGSSGCASRRQRDAAARGRAAARARGGAAAPYPSASRDAETATA